jgi:cobalt-zinc-cadmium efflux system protein
MNAGHSHAGAIPSAAGRHRKPLYAALVLTLTYMTAEIVGGIWTGSLALIADAAHMATDAGAWVLHYSLFISGKSLQPRRKTAIYAPKSWLLLSTRSCSFC